MSSAIIETTTSNSTSVNALQRPVSVAERSVRPCVACDMAGIPRAMIKLATAGTSAEARRAPFLPAVRGQTLTYSRHQAPL